MNANEITFGVEFEVTLPAENCPAVGRYHNGTQVNDLPMGWNAQGDCSISASGGHVGVEIVSPVLSGAEGLRQIKLVCDWLKSKGAKVNTSTGFHVHVGFEKDDSKLSRLAHLVANFEKGLFASTGTKTRERGRFCQPIANHAAMQRRFGQRQQVSVDRYHTLNVTNLDYNTKPTVEFRLFAGTTNATKAISYVRMCVGLVEKALSGRKISWSTKVAPTAGAEGQDNLTRLFYSLGWIKGRVSQVFGNVEGEGLPTISDCKKEMMRLAKKYDGDNAT